MLNISNNIFEYGKDINYEKRLIFLDIETTGLNSDKNQILSLGILYINTSTGEKKEFLENCKHKEYVVSSKALEINKIDISKHDGLTLQELDDKAVRFLLDTIYRERCIELSLKDRSNVCNCGVPPLYGNSTFATSNNSNKWITKSIQKESKIMPIGYNVGSFDMMFIDTYLKEFSKFFIHRAIDINSLMYLDAIRKNITYNENKEYYRNKFKMSHNALDDCRQSYKAYKEIVEGIENSR